VTAAVNSILICCWKLVLFGANDACLPEAPTLQHVPLQSFKKNLKALITHPLVVAQQPKIILVTPPPIDETQQEIMDATRGSPLARRAAVTAEYAEAVRGLGVEVGGELLVLDLWSAVMEEAILETPSFRPGGPLLGQRETGRSEALTNLMPDGLHLGSSGYKIFLRELLAAIEKKWPDTLGAETYIFPDWRIAPRILGDTTLKGVTS
jgi:lysophospholipase L1-like esterase